MIWRALGSSDDAKVMVRPFRAYALLGARAGGSRWEAAWGPLRWSLVVACFVSLTSSARLVIDHLVFAPLAWAFAPLTPKSPVVGYAPASALDAVARILGWLGMLALVLLRVRA
jgi:hypothetical protein